MWPGRCVTSCASRSSWWACRCTSRRASASHCSPSTAKHLRCCCSTQTSRCTRPNADSWGTRSSTLLATVALGIASRCSRSCASRSAPTSWSCTTNRSWTSASGAISGVEALVRWEHPTRGLLFPDSFLPIAERAGLMGLLARQVLEQSLRDLASWRAQNHQLSVAVNLSVSNLQDVELPQQVRAPAGHPRHPRQGAGAGDHREHPDGRR